MPLSKDISGPIHGPPIYYAENPIYPVVHLQLSRSLGPWDPNNDNTYNINISLLTYVCIYIYIYIYNGNNTTNTNTNNSNTNIYLSDDHNMLLPPAARPTNISSAKTAASQGAKTAP